MDGFTPTGSWSAISSMRVVLPSQMSGKSKGCMRAALPAASATRPSAYELVSTHWLPWTMTLAPRASIFLFTSGVAVSGRQTVVSTPSTLPQNAVARPALPPEELTSLVHPRSTAF